MRAVEILTDGVGTPSPVYLLKGTDGYLKREVVRAVQETVPPEMREFGIEEYGDEESVTNVINALYTVSFFASTKVVYLRRTKALNDADKKALADYIASPSDSSVLIIEDKGQNYTHVNKMCTIVDCNPATEAEVIKYVSSLLGESGAAIGTSALKKLYAYCAEDMGRIISEAQKLISFAGVGERVTDSDVDMLVAADAEYKMYELASALTDGDNNKALGILSSLRSKGEVPSRLLYNITLAYRRLFHMAITDMSDDECVKVFGMTARAVAFNRRFIAEHKKKISGYVLRLKEQVEYLYQLEYKFKSGSISDENALNLAMAKLLVANSR